MKTLFVTADDYGLVKDVSKGILQACFSGIATGISVLVNKASEEELEWLKECTNIGLGVHLNITKGKPILPARYVPSLVDAQGFFFPRWLEIQKKGKEEEIEAEFRAQIERFLSFHLPLHHLNTHHHIHIHPNILKIVIRLAKEYRTVVRSSTKEVHLRLVEENIPTTDHLLYDFYDEPEITPNGFFRLCSQLPQGSTEMVCHPGIVADQLFLESSYTYQRGIELGTLCREDVKKFLQKNKIHLASFADSKRLLRPRKKR